MTKPIKQFQKDLIIAEIYKCYGTIQNNYVVVIRSEELKLIRHKYFDDLELASDYASKELC